jgi:4-coumarate--CoA ligase
MVGPLSILPFVASLHVCPGTTEAAGTITMFSPDTKLGVPGSAGRLVPGIIAKVVKNDGTLAGFNEPGELQVKMPSVALGYVNNDEA